MQGVWGSICRSSWDNSESAIVCEYLGFQSESKFIQFVFSSEKIKDLDMQKLKPM